MRAYVITKGGSRQSGHVALATPDRRLRRTRIFIFVEFVALIYLSYIKGKMQEQGLFANYTMRQLLDELDVIECYEAPGCALTVGEVLKKQEMLYSALGVTPLPAKS